MSLQQAQINDKGDRYASNQVNINTDQIEINRQNIATNVIDIIKNENDIVILKANYVRLPFPGEWVMGATTSPTATLIISNYNEMINIWFDGVNFLGPLTGLATLNFNVLLPAAFIPAKNTFAPVTVIDGSRTAGAIELRNDGTILLYAKFDQTGTWSNNVTIGYDSFMVAYTV